MVNFPLRPKPDARFGVETWRVVGGPRVPGSPASPPIRWAVYVPLRVGGKIVVPQTAR